MTSSFCFPLLKKLVTAVVLVAKNGKLKTTSQPEWEAGFPHQTSSGRQSRRRVMWIQYSTVADAQYTG